MNLHILKESIFALAKSGTISLEICNFKIPSIIIYKMNSINFFIVKFLVKVKYANIINIAANKEIIPELLQSKCNSKNIFNTVDSFLNNKESAEKTTKIVEGNGKNVYSESVDLLDQSSVEDFSTDEVFDVIWLSHVLEHIIEPIHFLNKIKNNLKKDGVIFIEVPNCEYEPMLQNSIQKNPHLFHFTKNALSKLVENVGYKILSCDVFRPATKNEGMKQKIWKNSFPYYPRIITDVHNGRDLRIILKNS